MRKEFDMKRLLRHGAFDLQRFAEDPAGAGSDPAGGDPASGNSGGGDPAGGEPGGQDPPDITELLNAKFAEWEAAQKKAADEAKKLAGMNAQQKADLELQKMKDQLEEFQKKDALSEMTKVARGMLSDKHISASDELLSMMVSTDADSTKKAVDSFIGLFEKAVTDTVNEKLKGTTPRTGSAASNLSKADIDKIADRKERQQAIKDNLNLYIGGK